jgi:hypothetical protein
MGVLDDGTIDLLTSPEAQLITVLAPGWMTPTAASRALSRARGLVARDAAALSKLGLVKITRLPNDIHPKMTQYELTGHGEQLVIPISQRTTATGRFLTGEDFDALAAEAERGYDISSLAPVLCASCGLPVQGYARGRNREPLCHTDERRCYRDYVNRSYRL